MSTSNVIPVLAFNGGGGNSTTFLPTSSSLGTPIISGGTLDTLVVTDISGSLLGMPNNVIRFQATNSTGSPTVVIFPFELPVTPMPDNFRMDLLIFSGGPPDVEFSTAVAFLTEDNSKSWQISHVLPTTDVSASALQVFEVDTGVIGAQWNWPDKLTDNSVIVHAQVEKIAPFTATPQVVIDCDVGSFSTSKENLRASAYTFVPSTGTVSPGWEGEDWHHAAICCYFSTYAGEQNVFFSVKFTY